MNPTLYIKDGNYAVQYISETRNDKSLLIVLRTNEPIICRGDSTQFTLPDEYRRPFLDLDKHEKALVKQLQKIADKLEYGTNEHGIVSEMLTHLEAQQNRDYAYTKDQKSDADQLVEAFINIYKSERHLGDAHDNFYCGITYDIDIRMSEHERDDNKTHTKCWAFLCKTVDIAAEVEDRMRKEGFNVGETKTYANGAKEFSRFVYLYRK